jgi:hypothetical protein
VLNQWTVLSVAAAIISGNPGAIELAIRSRQSSLKVHILMIDDDTLKQLLGLTMN